MIAPSGSGTLTGHLRGSISCNHLVLQVTMQPQEDEEPASPQPSAGAGAPVETQAVERKSTSNHGQLKTRGQALPGRMNSGQLPKLRVGGSEAFSPKRKLPGVSLPRNQGAGIGF